jgi:hypothetical protein
LFEAAVASRATPHYRHLVMDAATAYRQHLYDLAADREADRTPRAAQALARSLDAAITRGPDIQASEVPFDRSLLDGASYAHLVDQHLLGLGNDSAPVIAVGTEQGWSPDDSLNFALLHCAVSLLWLTGSPAWLVAKLARDESWAVGQRRPFVVLPKDYYGLSRGRDTSTVLASIVGSALDWQPHGGLLNSDPTQLCLGDVCYMLDLLPEPSRYHVFGAKLKPDRGRFLRDFFATLRPTARAVILYGKRDPELDALREELAVIILRHPVAERLVRIESGRARRTERTLRTLEDAEGRRVLFASPLNGSVPPSYLDSIAAEIRDALRGWRPPIA